MEVHSDSENNDIKKYNDTNKSVTYWEEDSGRMCYDPYGAFKVPCNSPNGSPSCSPEIKAETKMVDRDLLKESLAKSFFLDYIRDEDTPRDEYFTCKSIVSEDEVFGKLTIDTDSIDNGSDDSDTESVYPVRDILDVDPRYATFNVLGYEVYKKPPKSSKAIRTIWKQAGLGEEATLYQIELHLVDWAQRYAEVYEDNFKITHISWKCTKRNMTLKTSWLVFIKWILCGCLTDSQ